MLRSTEPVVCILAAKGDWVSRLRDWFATVGVDVEAVSDGEQALNALHDRGADAIVLADDLPRLGGLQLIERVMGRDPSVCTILILGRRNFGVVNAAMRAGAHDAQVAPPDHQRLERVLSRGIEHRLLERRLEELERRVERRHGLKHLVGESPAMVELVDRIRQVSASSAPALISGESGSGKELVATTIHEHSARATRPFVKLSCARLSERMLQAELFGQESPDVDRSVQRGRLEIAAGGTLFIEEVSRLTPPIQARLLRVLEERLFHRDGSSRLLRADVRILAATSRNLEAETRAGRFRQDLYYRLGAAQLHIPPLRERREDVPLLIDAFLQEMMAERGKDVRGLSRGALRVLVSYSWPGNVRELRNTIEGMVLFGDPGSQLAVDDLPDALRPRDGGEAGVATEVGMTLGEMERRLIEATYRATGRDKRQTAATLGIGLRTLYRKLKEYELH